jgi:protein subunit release factor A
MADPLVAGNPAEFQRVAKAAAELEDQVSAYDKYKQAQAALQEAKELLRESDGPLIALRQSLHGNEWMSWRGHRIEIRLHAQVTRRWQNWPGRRSMSRIRSWKG